MARPTRAIEARRLKITDQLKDNVRWRYEHTDEPLSSMAADLGCCGETVRNIAKREGWVRYEPPPRDLSSAARLQARAEAMGGPSSPPLIPAQAGIQGQDCNAAMRGPGSPLSRGRADNSVQAETAPESPADTAEALHAAVVKELAEFKALRAQLKGQPLGLLERERAARTLSSLTATLHRLQAMRCAVPISGSDHDYDDMPADIDEFRRELARRIRIFVEGRRARSGAGTIPADDADAAQS